MSEVVPIYAQGLFSVSPGRVVMVVIFDYLDRGEYYAGLLRRGGEALAQELETLWDNMQGFLDEEEVLINGARVRPTVRDVYVGLRGDAKRPYIEYIIDFPAELKPGVNTYRNRYEPEVAEYDYEATWVLPERSELLRWNIAGEVEAPEPNILRVRVKKGTRVGGEEGFDFKIAF
jgi:hypothetical protein|nr:MAG: hypothetical protein TU35_00600 [Thermoproteus sp. AZ2]